MPKITFKNPQGRSRRRRSPSSASAGLSILDAAEECGARVGHACGGNLACSTCHVYVEQGLDSLREISDKENDIMDKAFDVRPESRLGCQAQARRRGRRRRDQRGEPARLARREPRRAQEATQRQQLRVTSRTTWCWLLGSQHVSVPAYAIVTSATARACVGPGMAEKGRVVADLAAARAHGLILGEPGLAVSRRRRRAPSRADREVAVASSRPRDPCRSRACEMLREHATSSIVESPGNRERGSRCAMEGRRAACSQRRSAASARDRRCGRRTATRPPQRSCTGTARDEAVAAILDDRAAGSDCRDRRRRRARADDHHAAIRARPQGARRARTRTRLQLIGLAGPRTDAVAGLVRHCRRWRAPAVAATSRQAHE